MSQASITENEKRQLVNALQTHRLNTIAELRRAEKSLATIDSADVSEPMTSACASSSWILDGVKKLTWLGTYYVNYHGLLTELRSLTRNYPFSSDCVEEAKRRVYSDPNSNRSWNLAWLVLTKIQSE
ncbi:hypothetical protein SLS55_007169 [Diplodia seriata]|uniref:Uncharacterized protein n=1 Tax=Diplodia seriata TaxID=420778 RepID=A0ABR3CBK1_9PEZI